MIPVIKPQELKNLQQNENLVLIDVRTGPDMAAQYEARHLQGALFADLETDLANKKADAANGGRHPLPDITIFAQFLGKLGIGPESMVVAYDDKSGANAAARFWWMLKAAGHENVAVLDGGLAAAVAAGYPTNNGPETPTSRSPYSVSSWQLPLATIEEVENVAQDADFLVIDVRDAARYRAEVEPIDLIAGHIPGARNIPFTNNLDPEGFYLPADELKQKYTEALGSRSTDQVIVHCGSGVTACHTLLAMDYAGLPMPKLYVGSWSEWSRTARPIGTGAEN